MIVLAAILGVAIGVTLGILGAGGSILAVPVLVHIAGLEVSAATATSLVAVGSAAGFAAIGQRKRVEGRLAISLIVVGGLGGVLGGFLSRRLADGPVLLAFSGIVLLAAYRMLRQRDRSSSGDRTGLLDRLRGDGESTAEFIGMVGSGLLVGALTGLFGVGGGFVIVPVLTIVLGREIREAIATSLVVIAGNAAISLLLRGPGTVDWGIAAVLTIPMLMGSVVGSHISSRIDPDRTRRIFALVLIAVAVGNAATVVF